MECCFFAAGASDPSRPPVGGPSSPLFRPPYSAPVLRVDLPSRWVSSRRAAEVPQKYHLGRFSPDEHGATLLFEQRPARSPELQCQYRPVQGPFWLSIALR